MPEPVGPADLVGIAHGASRALQRLLIAQSRASALGLLEFLVLARAADGQGVTPGEARRSLGLSTSTMAGLCDRLEEAELVRRHPHPTDGRLVQLRATPKGQRVRDRVLEPILGELGTEAEQLSHTERAVVAAFLERVTKHIGEQADALSEPGAGPDDGPAGSRPRTSTPRRARLRRR
jgi:DNA-binding MarR family transcriptional regulator